MTMSKGNFDENKFASSTDFENFWTKIAVAKQKGVVLHPPVPPPVPPVPTSPVVPALPIAQSFPVATQRAPVPVAKAVPVASMAPVAATATATPIATATATSPAVSPESSKGKVQPGKLVFSKPSSTASSNKFVGGYDSRDSPTNTRILPPIHGMTAIPLVTLEKAIKYIKIISRKQQLPYPSGFKLLTSNVYCAKQFTKRNWDKIEAKYGSRGMTKDLAAFINFYTHESPFYPVLNKTLRAENRIGLTPYLPFIKSFLSALYCLPLSPGNVKRGVKLDLSDQFSPGDEGPWWSFNSTTGKIGTLQSSQFLGSKGKRTMFDITANSLVSIKDFSPLEEDELILLPGTILEVCPDLLLRL